MSAFEKLKERMSGAKVTLSVILQAVNLCEDMLTTLPVHAIYYVLPVAQSYSDDGVDINKAGMSRTARNTQVDKNETAALGNSRQTSADTDRTWANDMAAAALTLATLSNRFSVLQRSDGYDYDDGKGNDSQSDNPYVEQRSRRKRKRRRQQSMLQHAHQQQRQLQLHPLNPRGGVVGTTVQQRDAQRGDIHNDVECQRSHHMLAARDLHDNRNNANQANNVSTNSSSVQRRYAAAAASGGRLRLKDSLL